MLLKIYFISNENELINQNLINHPDLNTDEFLLKDKVELISSNDCQIYIFSPIEGWTTGKSSALLRTKLENRRCEETKSNMYIIFIDKIVPWKFVITNKQSDLLIRPNLNSISIQNDEDEFGFILKFIKEFINSR
ncbi:hypothetical protein AYO37_00645 [Opitutia bacterium SCGC AG-212-L18]|nr:hypothetical protein AYO37_00645 [Opitutae bacterium SCGC AG-212-L18]